MNVSITGDEDDEDAKSLQNNFGNHLDHLQWWTTNHYDTYFEKTLDQSPETVSVNPSWPWTSVLLNQTILTEKAEEFVDAAFEVWVKRCLVDFEASCTNMYMWQLTLPRNDDQVTGEILSLKLPQVVSCIHNKSEVVMNSHK